ncbi:putative dual specificity phosphatase domain protein [Blattamonas nauphoetae]|uniref:Dual specificity phosphatase domain protein n=1 Tax=Blattamonas nauphoetae TaxID=2049346 RepID=A0ABQ9WXK2_9EUKA|nr:putative dual specificity phosphatase domain protein [Blattamonas nauphoetae]
MPPSRAKSSTKPPFPALQGAGSTSPVVSSPDRSSTVQIAKRKSTPISTLSSSMRNPDLTPVSKLRDGIYVGGSEAASSEQFILNNKITHIVNCTRSAVPNRFVRIGVQYLNIQIDDDDTADYISSDGQTAESVYHFICEAHSAFGGVLIHSFWGQNRAPLVTAAYLMRKFEWDAAFTIEIMLSCRKAHMRQSFQDQLYRYEDMVPSVTWTPELYEEEFVIRNTFFNKTISMPQTPAKPLTNTKVKFKLLPTVIGGQVSLSHPSPTNPTADSANSEVLPPSLKTRKVLKIQSTLDSPPMIIAPPIELLSQCRSLPIYEWMHLLTLQADLHHTVCQGEKNFVKESDERKKVAERAEQDFYDLFPSKRKKSEPQKKANIVETVAERQPNVVAKDTVAKNKEVSSDSEPPPNNPQPKKKATAASQKTKTTTQKKTSTTVSPPDETQSPAPVPKSKSAQPKPEKPANQDKKPTSQENDRVVAKNEKKEDKKTINPLSSPPTMSIQVPANPVQSPPTMESMESVIAPVSVTPVTATIPLVLPHLPSLPDTPKTEKPDSLFDFAPQIISPALSFPPHHRPQVSSPRVNPSNPLASSPFPPSQLSNTPTKFPATFLPTTNASASTTTPKFPFNVITLSTLDEAAEVKKKEDEEKKEEEKRTMEKPMEDEVRIEPKKETEKKGTLVAVHLTNDNNSGNEDEKKKDDSDKESVKKEDPKQEEKKEVPNPVEDKPSPPVKSVTTPIETKPERTLVHPPVRSSSMNRSSSYSTRFSLASHPRKEQSQSLSTAISLPTLLSSTQNNNDADPPQTRGRRPVVGTNQPYSVAPRVNFEQPIWERYQKPWQKRRYESEERKSKEGMTRPTGGSTLTRPRIPRRTTHTAQLTSPATAAPVIQTGERWDDEKNRTKDNGNKAAPLTSLPIPSSSHLRSTLPSSSLAALNSPPSLSSISSSFRPSFGMGGRGGAKRVGASLGQTKLSAFSAPKSVPPRRVSSFSQSAE